MRFSYVDSNTNRLQRFVAITMACWWVIGMLSSASTFASNSESTSATVPGSDGLDSTEQSIEFLVIEGELLTGESESGVPNAITHLHEQSSQAGRGSDLVLEYIPRIDSSEPVDDGSGGAAVDPSYTIWRSFDPELGEATRPDEGRTLMLSIESGSGFFLRLTIESDEGAIKPGFYADDESWVRVNALEDLGDGTLGLDLEYAFAIGEMLQSGRLRWNLAADERDLPFLVASDAELAGARLGGVAHHWIQFVDSLAGTPRYFAEQFSNVSVVSPEEALRLVAPDRRALESGSSDQHRTPKESEQSTSKVSAREAATPGLPRVPSLQPDVDQPTPVPASVPPELFFGGIAIGQRPPREGDSGTTAVEPVEPARDRPDRVVSTLSPADSAHPQSWSRHPRVGRTQSRSTAPIEAERDSDRDLDPPTFLSPAIEDRRPDVARLSRGARGSGDGGIAPAPKHEPETAREAFTRPRHSPASTSPNSSPSKSLHFSSAAESTGWIDQTFERLRELIRNALAWWWEASP